MNVERPRDALGRPLPRGADPSLVVAGPDPGVADSDAGTWAAALAYLEDGLPFHAHEVFEMRWRAAPGDDREAWRALAQWGAAVTHAVRGNSVGAQRLAARALATLDAAPAVPSCVDRAYVMSSCARLQGGHGAWQP